MTAPTALQCIEGEVGMTHRDLRRHPVFRNQRYADARRHTGLAALRLANTRQALRCTIGYVVHRRDISHTHRGEQGKLIAAQASEKLTRLQL